MSLDEMLNGFQPEAVPDDIYEADKFLPRFQPGQRIRFLFKLEEDQPERPAITVSEDKKIIRITYIAEALAIITKDGEQPIQPTSSGNQPTLRFQQVDSRSFKNNDGNVVPSSLHKLFRALVGRDAAKLTGTDPRLIVNKLMELSGRESFDGTVGWKLKVQLSENAYQEYSTATRKEKSYEKNDKTNIYSPWPLDGEGQLVRAIDGEYPRDFVTGFIEKKVAKVSEEVSA